MYSRCGQFLVVVCVALAATVLAHTAAKRATQQQAPLTSPMRYLQESYLQPHQTLGTSSTCASTITHHFKQQFACIVSDQSITNSVKHKDLQLLCAAFIIRMLALQKTGSHCSHCKQAQNRARTAEAACTAAAEQACRSKERAEKAESVASLLNQQLLQHKEAIMQLHSSKDVLCEQLAAAQLRSKCAPVYFDLLVDFIKSRCVTGREMKVSSADLHQGFDRFMQHAQHGKPKETIVPTPKQRELRALMETLGFEYTQTYLLGANARCLRGIQLRVSTHGTEKLA